MGGSHPAANGGAWMTAVFGFGGVKAGEEHVAINPRLYKKWTNLQFNMVYKGDRFNIKITKEDVTIIADISNKRKHTFIVSGKSIDCPRENLIHKISVKNKVTSFTSATIGARQFFKDQFGWVSGSRLKPGSK